MRGQRQCWQIPSGDRGQHKQHSDVRAGLWACDSSSISATCSIAALTRLKLLDPVGSGDPGRSWEAFAACSQRPGHTVATISTSGAKTSAGKYAVGKILKLRSDMLFLTMVETKRRIVVLTERDMCSQCEKEAAGGRVPPEIESFVLCFLSTSTSDYSLPVS